ncbi:hypothetical protein [Dasania marina]|uniref:hypothetical protein n=1 Tax=Dasania marina TaxID=471499 RepID=UPI0030DB59AF|tara:strand:- start:72315 stop:72752 length:438 start_codon:yes stop_codon:yes gene_type:complete
MELISWGEFWGAKVGGLRMACVAEKHIHWRNSGIEIILLIENTTKDDMQLLERRPFLDYDINVTCSDGTEVSANEDWLNSREPDFEKRASRTWVDINKEQAYIRPFKLSSFFNIESPGDYQVAVTRRMADSNLALSAPALRFRVI